MKRNLILSVLGALTVASTTSFAQDSVTYSSAYGNAQRTTIVTAPYGNAHPTINRVAPALSRFTASDFGFSPHGRQRERLHAADRVASGGYGRYADYGADGYGDSYLPNNYASYCGQLPKAC